MGELIRHLREGRIISDQSPAALEMQEVNSAAFLGLAKEDLRL